MWDLHQQSTQRQQLSKPDEDGYVGSDQIGTINNTPKPSRTGLDADILLGVVIFFFRENLTVAPTSARKVSHLRDVVLRMLRHQLTAIGTAASVRVGDSAVTPGCFGKPT